MVLDLFYIEYQHDDVIRRLILTLLYFASVY